MKILIADKFEAFGIQQLKEITDGVVCEPELKDETLTKRIAEFDPAILIVRSTKVQAPQFDAGKSLKLVIRAGSGVDTIDVPYATKKGIKVANCPGMNAIAVAELVMGHMLNMDRRIADNVADARAQVEQEGIQQGGRTEGSHAGHRGRRADWQRVAKRPGVRDERALLRRDSGYQARGRSALQAGQLGRPVQAVGHHHPSRSRYGRDQAPGQCRADRDHEEGRDDHQYQPPSVVDEPALIAALKSGHLKAAAVDVYDNEPAADAKEITSPLVDVPNLYGTHHISASTDQAQAAVAEETVRIVREFKKSGKVLNAVN